MAEGLRSAHARELALCRRAPKLHLRAVEPPVPANDAPNCSVEGQEAAFLRPDFIRMAMQTRLMGYFGELRCALAPFLKWLALRPHQKST